ncbi:MULTISPECIES: c-type cytochrome biogenesis protein CcmI [unclassified Avibacterium]|uniref:c-type cytochrome biogenesis protein CcmI n=1 Tax=unclassified Avibacterium TaxID=2685287 RepID=UPI0020269AFC|nr:MULTISPECIES: c-type cytochrome biogenesis protein CcmI [unclassified Avibacterium]MCW9698837.1 c-type cytochrome biogenesis protein CcmI [Avibacterium sp. 20-129]URL01747.1 c-type cytochrome biogenesis protein CcmI [Avibacterium sp. 20-126]URL06945.1 c-type cytochrome biogenesis protein CcmI [Avibacterium sp. 21-595]
MNFWLISLGVTLLIAVICFYPLLFSSKTEQDSNKRNKLNKAFYLNRLKELEDDEQQGLIEDTPQLRTELQQTLLQDIPENEPLQQDHKQYGKIWFVSGFLALAILAGLGYMRVGAWQQEAMIEKTYQKLPHFYERLKEEESKPMNEQELQQFAMALRLKLQKEPNNAADWWTLGQAAMNLNDARLAYDSYARAVKLDPENKEYQLSYARILMFSDDQTDKNKGMDLLKGVLRKDHTNLQALGLLAFQYFEAEEYKMAAVTWAMMLRLIPKDDPRVALLEKSIRAARDAQEEKEKANQKK